MRRRRELRKRDGKGIEVRQEMKEGQGRRAGGSEEMRWKGKRKRVRGERTEGREENGERRWRNRKRKSGK